MKRRLFRIAAVLFISFQLLVHTALCEPHLLRSFSINGSAMSNTLVNGEVVLGEILSESEDVRRGDVIICHYPDRGDTFFVKRLVALPGDTVAMRDGHLYVNGRQIADPEKMNQPPNYRFSDYLLKDDEYFVLGDNRGNSNDSHSIGPIPRSMIIARVTTVIWPLNVLRSVDNEFTAVKESPLTSP